jgi:hypothetical protein
MLLLNYYELGSNISVRRRRMQLIREIEAIRIGFRVHTSMYMLTLRIWLSCC